MPGGFKNKPKILRGAFIEFGLSLPPLFVVFQFNPDQLSRSRSVSYSAPNEVVTRRTQQGEEYTFERYVPLREFHQGRGLESDGDLLEIRERQRVTLQEESINFEIRLDATDKLNEGDPIAGEFGIAPELATLEAMIQPKGESILGQLLPDIKIGGHSFTRGDNPPMILFIWGIKRVLPVNINSMNITESEFNTSLDPIRATVSVNLTVIEGKNAPYMYSKALKEAMSVLNLANITDIANVVIPG